MSLAAYRVTKTQSVATAFDGEGARLHGGRWNSVGTRVVDVASSLSLATLELLVHTEDIDMIYGLYSVIRVEFDESLFKKLSRRSLPTGWHSPQPIPETQLLGDAWIRKGNSPVLEVPSAVSKSEKNYLINPLHADFSGIKIGKPYPFEPDARLR
ncbi:MAG: RES family NAD+ phosphorylase [Planctomycetales bacterium]|nr:RES family NAD+ phosphorylase [Planctomycetales bacterium]